MPDQIPTLHDIAAMLSMLERSEKAELAMQRDSLVVLAREHRVGNAAQPFATVLHCCSAPSWMA